MPASRVASHYGLGAASLPIGGAPYPQPPKPRFLTEFGFFREELHAQGHRIRRSMAVLPAGLLCIVVLATFTMTVLRDHADETGVVVTTFRDEPIQVPPPAELAKTEPPPPVAELAKIEPPPVVKPVKPKPVVAPVPVKPPPTRVAMPKPAPRPTPKPKARPRPAPVMVAAAPQLAAVPVQPERSRRPTPSMPSPVQSAPSVHIDQVALAETQAPTRARRPDRNRPAAGATQARPNLQPVARVSPTTNPAASASARSRRTPSFAPTRSRAGAPVAAPALAGLGATGSGSPSASSARAGSRATPPSGSTAAAAPRPRVAALGAPAPGARAAAAPSSNRASAASRPTSSHSSQTTSTAPGMAGVPLAALAACRSDRQEDSLKQRVIAAVTRQEQCVSRAGTYRFLETRNLNSFLMQVEQKPGRAVGDRCVELQYALDCLTGAR